MKPGIGSTVEWSSQAGSYRAKKHGVIVAIVPALMYQTRGVPGYSIQFDGGSRNHDSYLVAVKTGKDGWGKPKLYWPLVKNLKVVG